MSKSGLGLWLESSPCSHHGSSVWEKEIEGSIPEVEEAMDWLVITAFSAAGAYVGYVIGVLARGRVGGDGPGGREEPPRGPEPNPPDGEVDDFALWEFEVSPSYRAEMA